MHHAINKASVLAHLNDLEASLQQSLKQLVRVEAAIDAKDDWIQVPDPIDIEKRLFKAEASIRAEQSELTSVWQLLDCHPLETRLGSMARKHKYDALYEGEEAESDG